MILRRITNAFRKQDWFTVGIETLIVVLGVFLGIQLGNWNETRAMSRLGKDYTVRLIADLEQDLAANKAASAYYTQVLDSIETTDRLLYGEDPDAKELVAAAYRASEFNNNPASRATWDQIVSSGHLGLLPDAAIRSGLPDYYKFQDANLVGVYALQDTPYRVAVRSLIPLKVQLAIREGCSDVTDDINVISGFVAECRIDASDAVLEETAEALMASDTIRTSLRFQYSMIATVRNNIDGNVILLERVIGALGGTAE